MDEVSNYFNRRSTPRQIFICTEKGLREMEADVSACFEKRVQTRRVPLLDGLDGMR